MARSTNFFQLPAQRTEIRIMQAVEQAWCHRCKCQVNVKVIRTAHLDRDKALRVCSRCRSVIQRTNGKGES